MPGVDSTNIIAKQAIRFIIIVRHIIQRIRNKLGQKASERLWSVIATYSLQGRSVFDIILHTVHTHRHFESPYFSLTCVT